MMVLDVKDLEHQAINDSLRDIQSDCMLDGCCGQRFIAVGMSDKNVTVNDVPGNTLGTHLNGAVIIVNANSRDAVGDTMNEGEIIIYGSIGGRAGSFLGEYQAGGVIIVLGLNTDGKKIAHNFPCTGMQDGNIFL